jgi:flagella basal body P-ring formation protein FlgA
MTKVALLIIFLCAFFGAVFGYASTLRHAPLCKKVEYKSIVVIASKPIHPGEVIDAKNAQENKSQFDPRDVSLWKLIPSLGFAAGRRASREISVGELLQVSDLALDSTGGYIRIDNSVGR